MASPGPSGEQNGAQRRPAAPVRCETDPATHPHALMPPAVWQGERTPDLRSPLDPYHAEAYLIACLVKVWGWRVVEPGLLRRVVK